MIPAWAIRTAADNKAIEQGCFWDEDKAQAIIDFAEYVFKPQFIAGDFHLLKWQVEFLKSVYGWRNPNGTRRFRTVNLHIAKKNGKTLLVSLISAFELLNSEDPSSFAVSGSVTRENASQVFAELRHTLTGFFKSKLKKFTKITAHSKKICVPSLNAEYRSLSADGDSAQGLNCSLIVCDELHAMKNSGLYDSLRYATAARPNGLMILISTAGDDVTHFYYGIYSKSKKVLNGEDLDITHGAFIFEADPDADPEDRNLWRMANPSLGVSFTEDQFARDLEGAKQDPSEWNRFRRYRLNQWVRPDEAAYFDVIAWDRGKTTFSDDQLKKFPSWIGVDLSQTTDPSSVAQVWAMPERKFYVRCWAWVAREGVLYREKTNLPRYQQFAAQKEMVITDGNMIDSKLIFAHIWNLVKTFKVKACCFDPNSTYGLMADLEQHGVKVLRVPQTATYFSAPMKDLNKGISEGRILHEGSQWLRYCLSCVRVEERGDLIRPNTRSSLDHIDGFIAMCMAYSQAGMEPTNNLQPRSHPGIFVV